MATIFEAPVRPAVTADYRAKSRPRAIGLLVAIIGLIVTAIAFFGNLAVVAGTLTASDTLPWTFGLTTLGFGTAKLGIGLVLWGILMKLWLRIDSIKASLARLSTVDSSALPPEGEFETEYGRATITHGTPEDLGIHRMAKNMWRPMLVMGYMAVVIGFLVSLAWASGGGIAQSAWTQGLQFLGEGMLLAGISFLLGTILWAIRRGGGEVQEGLGVVVKTLKMPRIAKLFVALMMVGLMVSIAQFIGYLIVAGGGVATEAWLAFLGPFREFGLALILAAITLGLVTIGNALAFQFSRIQELLTPNH